MLSLLVLHVVAILTLELLLEMTEHLLRVARSRGVDEFFHRVSQQVVLHPWTWESPASHPLTEKEENVTAVVIG